MIGPENLSPNLSREGRKSRSGPGQLFYVLTCGDGFWVEFAGTAPGTAFSVPDSSGQVRYRCWSSCPGQLRTGLEPAPIGLCPSLSIKRDGTVPSPAADSVKFERNRVVATKTLPLAERPVFVCEQCWKPVRGDEGYLSVDLAAARMISRDSGRINWRVCHADCDDDARATDYRVWVRQFASMTDVVDTLCALADQKRWFALTNWSGLVRRVLREACPMPLRCKPCATRSTARV